MFLALCFKSPLERGRGWLCCGRDVFLRMERYTNPSSRVQTHPYPPRRELRSHRQYDLDLRPHLFFRADADSAFMQANDIQC